MTNVSVPPGYPPNILPTPTPPLSSSLVFTVVSGGGGGSDIDLLLSLFLPLSLYPPLTAMTHAPPKKGITDWSVCECTKIQHWYHCIFPGYSSHPVSPLYRAYLVTRLRHCFHPSDGAQVILCWGPIPTTL